MPKRLAIALPIALLAAITTAHAQQSAPIERIKTSDSELTCAQTHAEMAEMDKIAAAAREAEGQGNSTATAGTVAGAATQVAQRTGLFGLVGSVVSQVASSVAQQSGTQSAQEAAERARQASARRDYLGTLFAGRGCRESDLAFNPPLDPKLLASAAPQSAPAASREDLTAALAASVASLPDIDPDAHFKGQMGGTFGKNVTEVLPNNRRVAVMGFRVAFVTNNTVTAQVRASYLPGRDKSGARSKLSVALAGVDAATLQAITDKAYADFLAQLKQAGREVVAPEELKEFYSGLEATPSSAATPFLKEALGMTAAIFAPTGTPLWFTSWDGGWGDKSAFEQTNIRRMAEYSHKFNAIAVAPLIVVNFAQMHSSGNTSGFTSRAAETGAELNMHVAAFSSNYVRADDARGAGDNGAIRMEAPIGSNKSFGTMRQLAADDNRATKSVLDTLGKSMGLLNAGGAVRSASSHAAETNDVAYGAAAIDALSKSTGTFAKLFQKYPAK